jgi:hypothetical protein
MHPFTFTTNSLFSMTSGFLCLGGAKNEVPNFLLLHHRPLGRKLIFEGQCKSTVQYKSRSTRVPFNLVCIVVGASCPHWSMSPVLDVQQSPMPCCMNIFLLQCATCAHTKVKLLIIVILSAQDLLVSGKGFFLWSQINGTLYGTLKKLTNVCLYHYMALSQRAEAYRLMDQ